MPHTLSCPAPAKLNLMLRVIGRRADGYHELQTVFQFIDRQDRLDFTLREDGCINLLNDLSGVPAEQNLCIRAARLLQSRSDTPLGVDIHLHKVLPMGGGLGGGSSDAATTLVALNRLWELDLDLETLKQLGVSLGADVPIFIHGQAAWAEGIGETLTDLKLPEPWYLVIIPPCHVSTAEIFRHPDLTRHSPRIKIRAFLQGNNRNDCLDLVRRRHPEVARALDWLNQHAEARLTGTGACLFAAFSDRDQAERVLAQIPEDLEGFVARGLNRSPLKGDVLAEKQ
ncbi:MAG: 4-(cytidine 5'-diphospho)-2-C-methyl-D-erythritol kinase [Candidatus Thiodiazotropha sp.]